MARFKVIRSSLRAPHMIFEVQLIAGVIGVGQAFSLWDTYHRFDFEVSEVQQDGETTRLVCSSGFLQHVSPKERWLDMFASKQVDTENPTVAQGFSHKWSSR